MVANATQMVHISPVRFLRLQMVRGVFEASFSRLSVEAAASMRALVRALGFTGLDATACGFKDFEEMAEACEERHWAKDEGVGGWATFPRVDTHTGAIHQTEAEDSQALSQAVKAAGVQLGYSNKWGVWSVRKKGASEMEDDMGSGCATCWTSR